MRTHTKCETLFFPFCCDVATQLALQSHQERTQVYTVSGNRDLIFPRTQIIGGGTEDRRFSSSKKPKNQAWSITIQNNLLFFMCILFYSSFVCIYAYANVYFKTTITKQHIKKILIAGVPSSQALLGYLITAPPSVCVPDVTGVLSVWIKNQKKKKKSCKEKNARQAPCPPVRYSFLGPKPEWLVGC